MPPTLWIALAIIVVFITRKFSRPLGSALGLVMSLVVAGWGYWVYHQGGGMSLLAFRLPAGLFYGLAALWAALEVFELQRTLRRRRAKESPPADADDSEPAP